MSQSKVSALTVTTALSLLGGAVPDARAQEKVDVRVAREFIEGGWRARADCVLQVGVGQVRFTFGSIAQYILRKRLRALRDAGLVLIAEMNEAGSELWDIRPTPKLLQVARFASPGLYCLNGTKRTPLQHVQTDETSSAVGAPILVYFGYQADLPPEEVAFWSAYWGTAMGNPSNWKIRVHLVRDPYLPEGVRVKGTDAAPVALDWDRAEHTPVQ
jgi:hypothetical protein